MVNFHWTKCFTITDFLIISVRICPEQADTIHLQTHNSPYLPHINKVTKSACFLDGAVTRLKRSTSPAKSDDAVVTGN